MTNPNLNNGLTLGDILALMLAKAFGEVEPEVEDDGFVTVYEGGIWYV
jgi:hypothetical protein